MRLFRTSCSLILSLSLPAILAAAPIQVNPGTLGNILNEQTTGEQLTLTGNADIRDLMALKNLPAGVSTLDMSGLKLQSYDSRKAVYLGKSLILGDHLPAYIFFRSEVKNIVLPNGITYIEDGVFAGSEIESITIPEGVTGIGDYAFYGASKLKSVILPSTLEKIGKGAFANCPQLYDIDFAGTKVKEIPEKCFAGDSHLENLELYTIDAIGSEAFAGTSITQLILPEVEYFAPYALAGMEMLSELTLNSKAQYNEGTLMNNRNLVQLSGTPANVPALFAANCVSYSPTASLAGATEVGDYAFSNSGVSELYLGSNLNRVGKGIFSGGEYISEINATELGSNIPSADEDAFSGIEPSKIRLKVAAGKADEWKNHPVWGQFDVYDGLYTGIETPDVATADRTIDIRVSDANIIVTAPANIDMAAIYDADGKMAGMITNAGTEATLSLEAAPAGILIVSVKAGKDTKSIKVIR